MSETTIPGTDGHLTAPDITDRFQNPAKSNKEPDSSPQMPRDGTDLEVQGKPTERESQQDAFTSQQPGITEKLPEPAVGAAHRQAQSAGLTLKSSSCDGEEKRDQSKEALEMMQQEGWLQMQNRFKWKCFEEAGNSLINTISLRKLQTLPENVLRCAFGNETTKKIQQWTKRN